MSQNAERRAQWRDAVWESDLEPMQKLVALAFEKYAGTGIDEVWVSWPELMRLTGLSRDTVNRALKVLGPAGWLVVIERARQHRSARYALRIPLQQSNSRTPQQSDHQTADFPQQYDSRTPEPLQQSDPAPQQSDPAVPAVRQSYPNSKRTTTKNHNIAAAASDDPLADYRLTDDERTDFLTFIGAKSDGLLIHLARVGQLAARIAEWQLARDTHPRAERSLWDTPTVAEQRARDQANTEPPASPERIQQILREARERNQPKPPHDDYLDRW